MKKIIFALTCIIGASSFVTTPSLSAASTIGSIQASSASDTAIVGQQPIKADELPDAVVYTLADRYAGARILSVYFIEGAENKFYRVILLLADNNEETVFLTATGMIVNQ